MRVEDRPSRETVVLCAACGARFGARDARPGARVRCPLCGAPLVLGTLCRHRRRYRVRSAAGPRARRLEGSEIRALALRAAGLIAIGALVAAAWHWRHPIAACWRDARAAVLGSGRQG